MIGASAAVVGFVSATLLLKAARNDVETANGLMAKIGNGNCISPGQKADECNALYDANVRADTRYNWGHAMLGVGAVAVLATVTYALWPVTNSNHFATNSVEKFRSIAVGYGAGRGMISWGGDFEEMEGTNDVSIWMGELNSTGRGDSRQFISIDLREIPLRRPSYRFRATGEELRSGPHKRVHGRE